MNYEFRHWLWEGKYTIPDFKNSHRINQSDGSVKTIVEEHKDNAYWTTKGQVSMISVKEREK